MTDLKDSWKLTLSSDEEAIIEKVEDIDEESENSYEAPKKHDKEDMQHIPLITPIKEKQEFETPEDFDAYYQLNKDKFDHLTTHKLNKMFSIPGYRITKIKGVLSLKNIPQSRVTAAMKIETLELKVNEMKDRLNLCINTINKVMDVMNH